MLLDNFDSPSLSVFGSEGSELRGKVVIFCVTGSIAAIKAPQAIRLLVKHGARVVPVVSKNALKIVTLTSLKWASGVSPVTEISGDLEHIAYAGLKEQKADLIIVYPCSAATLSKISLGILDNTVSLFVGTALGLINNPIPVLLFPAMHEAMYVNPSIQSNIERLRNMGIHVIPPLLVEEKAKVANEGQVLLYVTKLLTPQTLDNSRVLVTAGPNHEPIDSVRFITTLSSGKMGFCVGQAAWESGASTTIIAGPNKLSLLPEVSVRSGITAKDMHDLILEQKNPDLIFLAAAMSDFVAEEKLSGKTPSNNNINVTLVPVEKTSKSIRGHFPKALIVLFKAEFGVSTEELCERAYLLLQKSKADFIVANHLHKENEGFESNYNHVYLINSAKEIVEFQGKKIDIARKLIVHCSSYLNNTS